MSFDEKLVALVRKNEVLFDSTHKDYKRPDIKDQVWQRIAEELNSTGEKCRTRWKNLRDTFKKCNRAPNLSTAGGYCQEKKTWKHYDMLSFLNNYQHSRKTTGNDDQDEQPLEIESMDVLATSSVSGQSENNEDDPIECLLQYFPATSIASPAVESKPTMKARQRMKRRREAENSIHEQFGEFMASAQRLLEAKCAKIEESTTVQFYKLMAERVEAANLPPAVKLNLEVQVSNLVYTTIVKHAVEENSSK